MDKINSLLQQVSIIQRKYDEIAKITGGNFNIFSIMRAESDEVRTHSRIIAEFLLIINYLEIQQLIIFKNLVIDDILDQEKHQYLVDELNSQKID